ncbi:hypothetical protein HPB50_000677 [Hyalomma asiaticum]|uniref:Uncharacterized protein n=1 Tax=Hyalomma asiaticum TaxID=266040 RepID=A0ACB7SLB0_HYAAI|nr:hypothetical protein HPB50_000677 [Hyalomma asiaticum]
MASQGTYRPPKDIKTNVEILRKVENSVLSKMEIAKKYEITKSTLSTYIKNKKSIIAGYEKQQMKPSRKRLRTSAHPQPEDALVVWIKQVRSRNLPLNGPINAAEATEFTTKTALGEFLASDGVSSRAVFEKAKQSNLFTQQHEKCPAFMANSDKGLMPAAPVQSTGSHAL